MAYNSTPLKHGGLGTRLSITVLHVRTYCACIGLEYTYTSIVDCYATADNMHVAATEAMNQCELYTLNPGLCLYNCLMVCPPPAQRQQRTLSSSL